MPRSARIRSDGRCSSTGATSATCFESSMGACALMQSEENPQFPNWDQDETAVAERYDLQDPATVSRELAAAAETVAARFDALRAEEWARPGLRSNGSVFTIESLGRYLLHDCVHHAWDIESQ